MRNKKLSLGLSMVFAVLAVATLATATRAAAQTETILHSFGSGTDGVGPGVSLIFDASGNLYGTTSSGGAYGTSTTGGTVFELTPQMGGGWSEAILYNFAGGIDGGGPNGVIFDAHGNLYGTTTVGGVNCGNYGYDCGAVFELSPAAGGGWTKTILHSFNNNGTEGFNPYSGLVFDGSGNLYGTTYDGGVYANGTVFELMPKTGGKWEEKILHSFDNNGKDAAWPTKSLILDTSGNLYGTTDEGGTDYAGTIFELVHMAGGGFVEKVIHSFEGVAGRKDGFHPQGSLIFDAASNLYGTTTQGGAHTYGTVFEFSPTTSGGWKESILYSFNYINDTDPQRPEGGLIFDASGNLYGTTVYGGAYDFPYGGYGTAFELIPTTGDSWTETLLHSFDDNGTDGDYPTGNLTFDPSGNLYGTTGEGGPNNAGTVFEITP